MRRIFVDPEFIFEHEVRLEGEGHHHAIDVLRFKKGDKFQIISGQDFLLTAELTDIQKKSATAKVIEKIAITPAPNPKIALAISLPRFATFEWIVEKSVELGVSEIQPIISEFSFVKKKSDVADAKIERWQKIIRSATEQTIRPDLLQVLPVLTLTEWANRTKDEPCLFGYEGEKAMPARQALKTLSSTKPEKIWALAGSEGGFSQQEVQSLLALGKQPATMGPQILRAETACVALISIIKYEFDHMTR